MASCPSQRHVRRTIRRNYECDPAKIRALPATGNLLIRPLPSTIPDAVRARSYHPPFLGLRLDKVLGRERQNTLIAQFDRMVELGLPHKLKTDSRSSTPAWHLATWSIYAKAPRITHESRNKDPRLDAAVDAFLSTIKKFLAPLISSVLATHAPRTWQRQQR